jgi:hypothetical protein
MPHTTIQVNKFCLLGSLGSKFLFWAKIAQFLMSIFAEGGNLILLTPMTKIVKAIKLENL